MDLDQLSGKIILRKRTSSRQILGLFFVLAISIFLFSSNALALESLDNGTTIDLLNQDPDPVKPGDILTIRLSIQNGGYEDMEDCVVELQPQYPFRALPEEKTVKEIGTLVKRSEGERGKVVEFKFKVENDVNEGKYPLTVCLYGKDGKNEPSLKKDLMIEVSSESNAEIEFISLEKLVPGEKTNLTFGVKNAGNSPIKNAMFSWECENDVILPVGSDNVKQINFIDIGNTSNVSYEVLTNVNTKPGLYKLDMTLTYDDIEALQTITEAGTVENQKRKQIQSKAGVYIGGNTDFDIAYVERSPTGAYTFSVSNIGNNIANSVKISLPPQANWTVQGGSKSVILGNLQKGDYTVADFNLTPRTSNEETPVKFEISYTASDGKRQVLEKELALSSSSLSESESSDSEMSSTYLVNSEASKKDGKSDSHSYLYKFIIITFVGIAGVLGYKRYYRKKKMDKWIRAQKPDEKE